MRFLLLACQRFHMMDCSRRAGGCRRIRLLPPAASPGERSILSHRPAPSTPPVPSSSSTRRCPVECCQISSEAVIAGLVPAIHNPARCAYCEGGGYGCPRASAGMTIAGRESGVSHERTAKPENSGFAPGTGAAGGLTACPPQGRAGTFLVKASRDAYILKWRRPCCSGRGRHGAGGPGPAIDQPATGGMRHDEPMVDGSLTDHGHQHYPVG